MENRGVVVILVLIVGAAILFSSFGEESGYASKVRLRAETGVPDAQIDNIINQEKQRAVPIWIIDIPEKTKIINRDNPYVELQNKEIRVVARIGGYIANIVFLNQGDYQRVVGGTGGLTINLDDLGFLLRMDAESKQPVEVRGSLKDAIDGARATICGKDILRGGIKLNDGTPVGIAFTIENMKGHENYLTGKLVASPPRYSIIEKWIGDVFDDCDFFAAGGCGDDCWNAYTEEGTPQAIIDAGRCEVVHAPWWTFDTCTCWPRGVPLPPGGL